MTDKDKSAQGQLCRHKFMACDFNTYINICPLVPILLKMLTWYSKFPEISFLSLFWLYNLHHSEFHKNITPHSGNKYY
jgi:hypothetical protein